MSPILRRVGLTLSASLVLVATLAFLARGQQSTSQALGQELIDELGLAAETDGAIQGCKYGSEVDGSLYCLDDHVSSGREFHILAMRLRGHEPTQKDLELLDLHILADSLEYEAQSDPEAAAELRDVLDRMDQLAAEGATISGA